MVYESPLEPSILHAQSFTEASHFVGREPVLIGHVRQDNERIAFVTLEICPLDRAARTFGQGRRIFATNPITHFRPLDKVTECWHLCKWERHFALNQLGYSEFWSRNARHSFGQPELDALWRQRLQARFRMLKHFSESAWSRTQTFKRPQALFCAYNDVTSEHTGNFIREIRDPLGLSCDVVVHALCAPKIAFLKNDDAQIE